MDKKPFTYLATFFMGAAIMRVVGFSLGYGTFEDKSVMVDPAVTLSAAITVGLMSVLALIYCAYKSLPSIHFTVRKILSHVAASSLSVCLWRLYAQSRGSRIPGLSYANSKALIVSVGLVSAVVLILMIFYEETDRTGS